MIFSEGKQLILLIICCKRFFFFVFCIIFVQSGSYVFTETQYELGVKPMIHVSHMVKHVRACTKPW